MFDEDFRVKRKKNNKFSQKQRKKKQIRDRFGKSRKNRVDDEESLQYLNNFMRGVEDT